MKKVVSKICALIMCASVLSFGADYLKMLKEGKCVQSMDAKPLDCSTLTQMCKPKIKTSTRQGVTLVSVEIPKPKDQKKGGLYGKVDFVEATSYRTGQKVLGLYSTTLDCVGPKCGEVKMAIMLQTMGEIPFEFGAPFGIDPIEAGALIEGGERTAEGWVIMKALQGANWVVPHMLMSSFSYGALSATCEDPSIKAAQKAEQERLAREEAERAEQERLAQEEVERMEREEQERLEREEQERLEREEQERLAREEAERLEREEQERLAREEAERLKREEQERLEQERLAQEEAQRLEREEKARRERARKEQEQQANNWDDFEDESEMEAHRQRIAEKKAEKKAAEEAAAAESANSGNDKNFAIGLHAELDYASYVSGKNESYFNDGDFFDNWLGVNVSAGFAAKYKVNEMFAVVSGLDLNILVFSRMGTGHKVINANVSGPWTFYGFASGFYHGTTSSQMNLYAEISIPLKARVYFAEKFFAEAGLRLDYVMLGVSSYTLTDDYAAAFEGADASFEPSSAAVPGLLIGAGVELPSGANKMDLSLQIVYGLSDLGVDTFAKARVLELGVNWVLWL